ncbi:serine/threonine-protein kinase/endoribonuclease IRE1 [Anoplolepis gracilipes]|uniref:serine/threonine-protein kinase/endoribonuclease IRE1 n=1 Tax=Anoplolepis gracilipes TaxID=354296 RepID=UPI003B9FE68E
MQMWMTIQLIMLVILIIFAFFARQQMVDSFSTELVTEKDNILVFSTLGGSLVGVNQQSGYKFWEQNNEPVVKVPIDISKPPTPTFLPDPRDGSLYLFGKDSELKKLPFTIPELVTNSPCRSSEGIYYTGKKIDTWFSIDLTTGQREQLSFNGNKNTCHLEMQNTIFVGRSEYNIVMADRKKDRKWNVTFYDYSAAQVRPDIISNYNFLHYTTSSTGRVVTLDKFGNNLWKLDLKSPVIAVYIVTKDGLQAIPFTIIDDCSLDSYATKQLDIQFFPTLFVGKHKHGLYALPSLVDSSITISSNIGNSLLEGLLLPSHINTDNKLPGDHVYIPNIDKADDGWNMIGYKPQTPLLQITGRSDPIILDASTSNVTNMKLPIGIQANISNNTFQLGSNHTLQRILSNVHSTAEWINQENGLKLLFLIIFIGFTILILKCQHVQNKRHQQLSQISRESSRTSYSGKSDSSIAMSEPIGESLMKVGKIIFDTGQILGKGCDGTFVYKGEFDGRAVAVKRLLPDCFTVADREVALLRESDAHANVVRYFCTEQDRMFRYIALELAEATLQDYVSGNYNREKISVKNILHQATSGLAHLHSLDIVHRDIKPHNVLLSVPGPRGEVRAMISDFGLCKKLQLGRVSFSGRSGITGTDGWIAPEMLNGERTTCAVDIFSLGCVFYYVLSDGKHPFGDPLRRQVNILCGEINLTALKEISSSDKELALLLIEAMICRNPTERPPASAICNYPFFWNSAEILSFFQDISDRVEKDQFDSPALVALETCSECVVRDDWRMHIDLEVATDLRKYRSYRGNSVRDLLRALRNKKHHYRELSPKAQESLGEIPEKFTEYWLSRFPCLLRHVWCAMQSFRDESTLKQYYHSQYTFATGYEEQELTKFTHIEQINKENQSMRTKMRQTNNIDWSPNRIKYRGQRKKQEKRKQDESSPWILPN